MPTQSEQLARFALELRLSDVAPEIVTKIKEHILDTVGVTLLGTTVPFILPVRQYALAYGTSGNSTLVGPPSDKLDAEDAAIFNATAAMATELDNHHVASSHPCSVVPAALAVGEEFSSSGAACLAAIAVGYEITSRLAMSTTTSLSFDRNHVNSAVYNGFGVAVGAAMLMGMDLDQTANALAITGSHASGIGPNARYSTGRYHAGAPAANGIRAARLARFGLRGSPEIFEDPRGYFKTFSAHPKPELLTDDLGNDLVGVTGLRLKHPFASTGNIAPQIETLRKILVGNGINHRDVAEIRVGADPLMFTTTTSGPQFEQMEGVDDVTAGHFCTPLQLAIAATRERNDFPTLMAVAEGGFRDPDLRRIAGLVTVAIDPECEALFPDVWMTKVAVVTTDGRTFEERGYAMTEPDVYEKFREITERIIPATQAEALIDRVMSIEDVNDIGEITALTVLPAA